MFRLCPNEKLCDEFIHNGRRTIREILAMKLAKNMDEFEVYQLIPTGHQSEDIPFENVHFFNWAENFEYKLFAQYSAPTIVASKKDAAENNAKNFQFHADYRPFSNGVQTSENGNNADSEQPIVVSRCRTPFCKCLNGKMLVFFQPNKIISFSFFRNNFADGNEANGKAASSYIRREPARKGNDDSEELLQIYENSADDPVKSSYQLTNYSHTKTFRKSKNCAQAKWNANWRKHCAQFS